MPGEELLLLIGGGGAAAYVATRKPAAPPATATGPNGGSLVQGGANKPLANVVTNTGHIPVGLRALRLVQVTPSKAADPILSQSSTTQMGSDIDQALKQKLDTLNGYAEAAYNNLDDAAKQKGAEILNDQFKLDPPLKGDETWEQISEVAGSAVGGAVGGYIGGPIGAKLGALCGAYLGKKIEEYLSQNIDDAKQWLKDEWGDVSGWVEDTASDVYNDVKDYVGGLF